VSAFGVVSVVALELVVPLGVDDVADELLLGDVELGDVELDESVLALALDDGAEGVVAADDDEAGGVDGVTTVVELEEDGGVEAVPGAASWRCWHAPSASSKLAATTVWIRRIMVELLCK
jgi:hypothetical protein